MNFEYQIETSSRLRQARISIDIDGRVLVKRPVDMSIHAVNAFVESKRIWVEKVLVRFEKARRRREKSGKSLIDMPKLRRSTKMHREAIVTARKLVLKRLVALNQAYGFQYRYVSIRSQKTRWGSCSTRGTLSFNYRLIYLPPPLVDYVIAHELCHLQQMNHSVAFWTLVSRAAPDWKQLRCELRRYRF